MIANRPKKGSQGFRDFKRQRERVPRGNHRGEFLAFKIGMATAKVTYLKANPDVKKPAQTIEDMIPVTLFEVPKTMDIEAVNFYDSSNRKIGTVGSPKAHSLIYRTKSSDVPSCPSTYSLVLSVDCSAVRAIPQKSRIYFESVRKPVESMTEMEHLLGGSIPVETHFDSPFFDAVGITKGRGFSSVVKRYGVKLLNKGSKKKRRAIANQGGKSPGYTRPTVGAAGQLGLQRRTVLSLRNIFFTSSTSVSFPNYGTVSSNSFVLGVMGSVPGPHRRPIFLRKAFRTLTCKPLEYVFGGIFPKN